MVYEELTCLIIFLGQNFADRFIDLTCFLFAVVLATDQIATQEDVRARVPVRHGTESLAHSVLGHHSARPTRRLLEIVAGAGRKMMKDDVLRRSPAHCVANHCVDLLLSVVESILFGQRLRQTQRHATRNDRHLVNGIRVFGREHRHEGMARLVEGRHAFVLVTHDHAVPRGPHKNLVLRVLEILVSHARRVAPRREQCGLVDEVLEIRAHHARCSPSL